jgi:hypothetical protein
MGLRRSKAASSKRTQRDFAPDYPLQDTPLDLPMSTVLRFVPAQRRKYIDELIKEFRKRVKKDEMALKKRTSFGVEMKDLRNLFYAPADRYLFTDEKNGKRWVLGKGSPGSSHVYWSRNNIWKMKTKGGSLYDQILHGSPALVKTLDRYLDPEITNKTSFRNPNR